MDRTLIRVKPDAFSRGLTGEILARFERKGLKIAGLRHMTVTRELAERHYAEHAQRPFFGELVQFITSGPIVALVLEGEHAVTAARQVIGATDPLQAASGSIRGDFALELGQNMVHGSDSPESAARGTLAALGGATHEVLSGLVLLMADEQRTAVARTAVTFRALDERLLDWYVATGEWRGRSGGYAIQKAGAALVRAIEGECENVVGLPLATLLDLYPDLLAR